MILTTTRKKLIVIITLITSILYYKLVITKARIIIVMTTTRTIIPISSKTDNGNETLNRRSAGIRSRAMTAHAPAFGSLRHRV